MELDARLQFDNFVVGSANRLAAAAARAVAEAPGAAYNPLFIYSSSGLGKTHLLAAAGQHARALQPELHVYYVTVDEFVDQLHAAVSGGSMEAFKARYHGVDMLLLDDVQFLAGQRETQSEMLRLFNVLQQSGRQIVLTSDCPPTEIADLDERLITRFSGGLVVDIGEPDYETRVAILRRNCDDRGVRFETGVIEELSRCGFGNVRELQGALNRLVAIQTLDRTPVTTATVRALLGDNLSETPQPSAGASDGEFESFLSDLTEAVAGCIEPGRVQLTDQIRYWRGEGYRTAWLERALNADGVPNADTLIAEYEAAVARLRALEEQGAAVDPALAGAPYFRDPERIADAEEMIQRSLAVTLPGPDPRLSLSTFEVGPPNQLAARAAHAVVREPGARYNPLVLHGPVGAGKTHLANAIGLGLAEQRDGARVACIAARAFGDELIDALQAGTVERWRARYRVVDALILDDVQDLAGTERTQEEVFHLFNALYASGRQIVLTSDRAPAALEGLDERLRSRFEGGLVVEILPRDVHAAAEPVDGLCVPTRTPVRAARGPDPFFLDRGKVTWDWPELSDRVIEEMA